MRNISNDGIALIKQLEGERLKVYKDVAGYPTVGVGHLVVPTDNLKVGDVITSTRSTDLLKGDLQRTISGIDGVIPKTANQNQFDACVSLAFNIGVNAFKNSTLLKLFIKGDIQGAADQFLVWRKAGGKVVNGLENRRKVERGYFLK